VCSAAVEKLRAALGGAISLPAILDADVEIIRKAIASVGFWQKKAMYVYARRCRPQRLTRGRFIKESAHLLRDNFEGDVPKDMKDLCTLPGVGPKVAFLTLQNAWDM
jgi:endonuclease III